MNVAGYIFAAMAAVFWPVTLWAQEQPKPAADAPALAAAVVPANTPSSPTSPVDSPYAGIVARNMFALVPIPPPDPNAGLPPVDPPPKITPTGIMTIFGRDQALFSAAPDKPKSGQAPKESSYVLAEGERQDDIEVVKIDHDIDIITFNNHGVIQELPLVASKDVDAGPGPGGRPGGVGPDGQKPDSGRRNPRMLGRGLAGANPDLSGSLRKAATGSGNQGGTNIEDQVMAAARQMKAIEEQRKAFQQSGDPRAALLPPTQPPNQN